MDDEDHPDYYLFKAISLPDKDVQVTDFYLYNITFLNFSLLG